MHELGAIIAGEAQPRRDPGAIVYYKNNSGLAIQFAACGAVLYRKLLVEGTNRIIPREWFASRRT